MGGSAPRPPVPARSPRPSKPRSVDLARRPATVGSARQASQGRRVRAENPHGRRLSSRAASTTHPRPREQGSTCSVTDRQSRPTQRPLTSSASHRWNLRGLSLIAFAHGLSDFYSGALSRSSSSIVVSARARFAVRSGRARLSVVPDEFGRAAVLRRVLRQTRPLVVPAGGDALTIAGVSLSGIVHSIAAARALHRPRRTRVGRHASRSGQILRDAERLAQGRRNFDLPDRRPDRICRRSRRRRAVLLARFGGEGTLALFVPGRIARRWTCSLGCRTSTVPPLRAHTAARATPRLSPARVDRVGIGLLVASTGLRYFTSAAFMTYLAEPVWSIAASR